MAENLLSRETSPYLLQHQHNPVHWRPWSPETLAEAQERNKPILLSIGYAACHWCHVMAHESFENQDISALMNDLFINIKVDREERPDIDSIYQSALALMGQQGGWPLTMFLTPTGEPFFGGTYYPPAPRYGRPGFPELLRAVSKAYHSERDKVDNNVVALRDALSRLTAPAPGPGLTPEILDSTAATLLRLVDPVRGGTTGAPKFPQPVLFRFLWRAYKRTGSTLFRDTVHTTLNALCQGGIYDHLAGGFSRYSTDEEWLVPHFEKMLYDNALLIDLLTEVWVDTGTTLYATRTRETIEWALAEMRSGYDGDNRFAFTSAFDADSEGEEGKYYVWTEAEIDALLDGASPVFKEAYDVTTPGNWEGRTILNRRNAPETDSPAVEAKLAECRATLLAARALRVPPQRDDKVLADWNGLMIAALANASAAFDERPWLDAAQTVFAFVNEEMQIDGRLRHVWCAGQARHPAVIDDYANMARAALALFEVTSDPNYLRQAQDWVDVADRHYWDDRTGGYFFSADDTSDLITRSKTAADNATPAGNGTMAEVLARLFYHTGNSGYRERADDIIRLFSDDNPQSLLSSPNLLSAYELLQTATQIIIIGPLDDPLLADLRLTSFQFPVACKVVSILDSTHSLPADHPAHGKEQIDGKPTAYVCTGMTCSLPVTDSAALKQHLSSQ
jgi:hypothetical protein